MTIRRFVIAFGLLAMATCLPLAPSAFGQIRSTISCPSGHSYWDVLSVMMMDPGLASSYHMEGIIINGGPSSYVYTIWNQSQAKLYYVKNPQGYPWDINLYDSNYIYQWVTELNWTDPASCKKFNNANQNSTSDRSMRWASRCAAPGGDNSSFWNPPPNPNRTPPNPIYNTNYYTYVDRVLQGAQDLGYSLLELKPTGTITITDHRANPPLPFSVTTLPLQYTYSCDSANVNSCLWREIDEYGLDTGVNPVDNVKHSYGWIRWRYYKNLAYASKATVPLPAVWALQNTSTSDQLVAAQVSANFQCF